MPRTGSRLAARLAALLAALLLTACLGACTFQRTAEVRTADALTAHLEAAGVAPDLSLRISRAALAAAPGSGMGLPRLQVFDASGVLVHDEEGYTLGLAARLEKVLADGEPLVPRRTLEEESRAYETLAGEPATVGVGDAELVLVDHWATWCAPCKPQARAVQRFIAEHPERRIRWVMVSWDEMAAGEAG